MSMGVASAQMTPAEIRAILGGPIDVEEAALFAATRTSYKQLCGQNPWAEFHATIINRMNYGSLDKETQRKFKELMQIQMQSNLTLFQGMGVVLQKHMCEGLNQAVTSMAATFVQKHSHLFEETPPAGNAHDGMKTSTFLSPFARAEVPHVTRDSEQKEEQEIEPERRVPGLIDTKQYRGKFKSFTGQSRGERHLEQSQAEAIPSVTAVGMAWESGNSLLYQGYRLFMRKLEAGERDENWRGETIRNWAKARGVDNADVHKYMSTMNLHQAEAQFADYNKNMQTRRNLELRGGFSTFLALVLVNLLDPLLVVSAWLLVIVAKRAYYVPFIGGGLGIVYAMLVMLDGYQQSSGLRESTIQSSLIAALLHSILAFSIYWWIKNKAKVPDKQPYRAISVGLLCVMAITLTAVPGAMMVIIQN